MEKIIQITINSTLFSIEESAYSTLSSYLSDIKSVFESEIEGQEIIKDIEARVAEHLKAGSGDYITSTLVEAVISKIGKASDFEDNQGSDYTMPLQNNPSTQKRLFRDEENAVLGGVCAGLSSYTNTDVTWVRVAFIVLVFLGFGLIIPIYIILWLITPPAITIEERLEMHGSAVDINSIVKNVRARINELRDHHKCCDKHETHAKNECSSACKAETVILKERATKIVTKIASVFTVIFRIIIGTIITMVGILIMIGFAFVFSLFISKGIPYEYSSLLPTSSSDPFLKALIFSSIAFVLMPAMLISHEGVSIIKNKPIGKSRYGFVTLLLWMLSLTTMIICIAHFGIDLAVNNRANNSPVIRQVIINEGSETNRPNSDELRMILKTGTVN